MDTFYQRAYSLISSQKAREAFDIDAEPDAIRDEYGRNAAGQRMLMARRLVDAGVRFVSLTYGGWDMHAGIAGGMQGQLPAFDQAFAALISDLDRTRPARQRRWSWSPASSAARRRSTGRRPRPLAEGVQRRPRRRRHQEGLHLRRVGRDRQRAGATTRSAEDLATTVYHQLGIDADKELMAPGDRPIEIVDGGKVRKELLALTSAEHVGARRSDEQTRGRVACPPPPPKPTPPEPATSSRRSPLDDVPSHATDPSTRSSRPSGLMAALALSILAVAAPQLTRPRPASRRSGRAAASAGPRSSSPSPAPGSPTRRKSSSISRGSPSTKLEVVNDDHVKATLKIAPDCRARRCTTSGSAPRPASASCGRSASAPCRTSTRSSRTTTSPRRSRSPLNVTVNGVADNEDVDYFAVEAKKGERITAEVEGIRLGHHALRPVRRDPRRQAVRAGRPATTPPWSGRTAFASVVAPEDGKYIVQVRESAYARQRRLPLPAARRQLPPADGDASPAGGKLGEDGRGHAGSATSRARQTTKLTLPATPDRDFGLVAQDEQGRRPLSERLPPLARSAT